MTDARITPLLEAHRQLAGAGTPRVFQAPGRVNLLGEHTDYSGGFCMPAAISFNTLVAATPRADGVLRLHSIDFNGTVELPLERLKTPEKLPAGQDWSAYCLGVAWSLMARGIPVNGADLTITGNVPLGAGLSSSASVEVAVATALLGLAGATLEKPQVALACQKAENVYVGSPCGIMDQYIAAAGIRDHALAIDTRAMTAQPAPIPHTLRLVVCNSMVKHTVTAGSPYAKVRREVEEAAAALHGINPAIVQLRDATLADLEAGERAMSHEAFLRARHVITDSQRVLDGVELLRAGDEAGFGRLMVDAHRSFRDDFGASCRECDLLVELAVKLPGCLGSRLTGGGFGGCTVSLLEAAAADDFARALVEGYRQQTGIAADVFVCEIADGASGVTL